jgi:hypothetical protein
MAYLVRDALLAAAASRPYAGSPVKTPTLAYRSKGISNSSGAEDVVLVHALAHKPEGSRCDSGPGVKHAEEMI